jgi:hypothetical protein
MIVMATMPTNTKVMRRDLIDPLCSVLRLSANLVSSASSLELDFRSLRVPLSRHIAALAAKMASLSAAVDDRQKRQQNDEQTDAGRATRTHRRSMKKPAGKNRRA